MLACISNMEINIHETLSTVQYACRARAIQNKLIANVMTAQDGMEDPLSMSRGIKELETNLISALRDQLMKLENELQIAKNNQNNQQQRVGGHNLGEYKYTIWNYIVVYFLFKAT